MAMKESPNLLCICKSACLFTQIPFEYMPYCLENSSMPYHNKNKLLSSKGKPLSVSYFVRNIVTFMQISFCLFLPLACGLAKHNSILVPIKIASISEFYIYMVGNQGGSLCHNLWNLNHQFNNLKSLNIFKYCQCEDYAFAPLLLRP